MVCLQISPPTRHCCEANARHNTEDNSSSLVVHLEGVPSVGLCWLEAERGPYIGASYPLLVLPGDCDAAAAELESVLQFINHTQQQHNLKVGDAPLGLPWALWAPSARGLVCDIGFLLRATSCGQQPEWADFVRANLLEFAAIHSLHAVAHMLISAGF